jgi:antitoxin MazE
MRIFKWGDGLAVGLPTTLIDELGLIPGDELEVVDATRTEIAVAKVDQRARFLERMEQFRWPLPEGYKFDRDEANKR